MVLFGDAVVDSEVFSAYLRDRLALGGSQKAEI